MASTYLAKALAAAHQSDAPRYLIEAINQSSEPAIVRSLRAARIGALQKLATFSLWASTVLWNDMRNLWNFKLGGIPVLQAAILPMIILWLQRKKRLLEQWLSDFIFLQIRFKKDDALRSFISQRKPGSVAMFVQSQDDNAEDEVLEDASNKLFKYRLLAPGATPCYVSHIPDQAGDTWLWLPSADYPAYTLPLVWFTPDVDRFPYWESLPAGAQKILAECWLAATRMFPHLIELTKPDENHRTGKLIVSCFRWNKRAMIEQVINEATELARKRATMACTIWHLQTDGPKAIKAPPRKMDTVILGDDGKGLLADIESFLSNREWYKENDIPYQRVYLLHGPPGNGKSSFLQAASILFRMPYCYLEMTGRKLTIEGLRNVLSENTLKIPCLLALEDAESLFAEEKEEKDSSKDDDQEKMFQAMMEAQASQDDKKKDGDKQMQKYGVTAADLVQMLESRTSAPAGRIIFFTTNHVDRLHLDLIRLVDEQGMRVLFPNADLKIMEGMWRQFYKSDTGSQITQAMIDDAWANFKQNFSEINADDMMKFSAASMQEYMMRFRFDPAAAAERVNVASMNARGQRDTHEPAEAEAVDVVDYKAQITAICEQYAPEHLGEVDAMLQQYQGREEKLLGKILRKYCPPAVGVDKASNATYLLKATQESMSATDPKYLLGCIASASESADPSSEDKADGMPTKPTDPLSESSRDAEESQERLYDEGEHLFDVCKGAGDTLDKEGMMSFANTPEGAQLRRLVGAKWVLFNQMQQIVGSKTSVTRDEFAEEYCRIAFFGSASSPEVAMPEAEAVAVVVAAEQLPVDDAACPVALLPLSPEAPAGQVTTWSSILQTNLCKKDGAALRAEAEKVYAAADVNGDGGLSKTEMKKVLQKDAGLRAKLVSGSWKEFFAVLDKDGDGTVDLAEFITFYTKKLSTE